MRSALPALLLLLVALAPEAGSACSMCLASQGEDVRYAFLWTTGFLSLLPVGMLGLAVWWLRRRVRAQDQREAARSRAGVPSTSA